MTMWVSEMGGSESRPVMGRIEVASPWLGQHHLAGNGADFSLVLERETIGGTDEGSKANDDGVAVGAASHTSLGSSVGV
jgi:hypothetical protein